MLRNRGLRIKGTEQSRSQQTMGRAGALIAISHDLNRARDMYAIQLDNWSIAIPGV
jgi:hypothetical protein